MQLATTVNLPCSQRAIPKPTSFQQLHFGPAMPRHRCSEFLNSGRWTNLKTLCEQAQPNQARARSGGSTRWPPRPKGRSGSGDRSEHRCSNRRGAILSLKVVPLKVAGQERGLADFLSLPLRLRSSSQPCRRCRFSLSRLPEGPVDLPHRRNYNVITPVISGRTHERGRIQVP